MPDGRQTYCRDCFADIYREKRSAAGLITRPGNIPDGHKFCRGCQLIKPLEAFGADTRIKAGPSFRCSECSRQRDRQRYLDATYGLTDEEVKELLATQDGLCAICQSVPAVHVDHDHKTGKVRGMLCFRCNAALGQFDDQPAVLMRAARYLMAAVSKPASEISRIEVTYTERFAEVEFGTAS